ncbi:MAG: 4Fe-4S binding protein, partial [Caldisericales bacterium]|nr:4Fe-4S binding protein [Caldisericales bacterium]
MRITPRWMAVFIVTVLFGGILLSIALGEWTTKSTKEPLTFAEGEFAGEYNPADIRGSYTFGEISRLFEIPLE